MKKFNQIRFCLILLTIFLSTNSLFGHDIDTISIDTSYFKEGQKDQNLLESVIKNHPENTKMLLERGADPNVLSSTKNSALMYAVEKGNMEIMKLLIEYGAEINVAGFNGETPLFLAIFRNDFQAAKFLLENGANPNVKDAFGVTPLIYAAATNQYQSADLLMFYTADPEVTDSDGNDPLLSAVTFENLETSDVLMQNGLNPDIQDKKGNTPAIVAIQHGVYDLLELLLEYDADINIPNNINYTPLAYAITYGDVKSASLLIEKGADINHQIDKGRNISDLARISGNDSLIDMIETNGGIATPGLDFSEFNFTYGNSFNKTDYLLQFRGGLADTKHGYYFETGIDFRPYLSKIQIPIDDTIFQFRERRIGWTHGIGKYQKLYESPSGVSVSLYGSLNGFLSFPQYMGVSAKEGISYKLVPSAGLAVYGKYAGLKAGADWYNFKNELDKGLKINISVFLRISYPEMHYDRKE
ncbi:MAG: ankyrin repeat domain-containing protein, partial [Bacteroidales bacterium]|nr:ankyrin repeat domain-containing protein [Bacteroidales bacterium]